MIHPTAKEAIPFVGVVQLPARSISSISPTNYHKAMEHLLQSVTGLTAAIEVTTWYKHGCPAPEEPAAKTYECKDCGVVEVKTTPNQKYCASCRHERKLGAKAASRVRPAEKCPNPECGAIFTPTRARQAYCNPKCRIAHHNALRRKGQERMEWEASRKRSKA